MANLKTFPQAPYHDDYSSSKDYLRVLFRPGYAVQTRELNTLQTILQNQISRFGDHFFENGARVYRGECSVDNFVPFLKLNGQLSRTLGLYKNVEIVSPNGAVAKISALLNSTATDPVTLYVNQISGTGGDLVSFPGSGDYVIRHTDGTTETVTVTGTGNASIYVTAEGIYYFNGQFVVVHPQSYVLNKYAPLANGTTVSMGFIVTNTVVAPTDDISLYDNAAGTTNYTAPGAHRFKISLTLTHKPTDANLLKDYVEISRVVDGVLADKSSTDSYTMFQDILAERTYDESGNYVVDPFVLDVREHLLVNDNRGIFTADKGGVESNLVYMLDPGRAYVRGYKVDTTYNTYLTAPKARTYQQNSNVVTTLSYDSNITVTTDGMFKIGANVDLIENAITIGYGTVRDVRYSAVGSVVVDLVNITIPQPNGLSNVTSCFQSITGTGGVVTSYSYDATNSSLVYPIPFGFVQSYLGGLLYYRTEFSATPTGNTVNISSSDSFSSFEHDYVVQYTDAIGNVVDKPLSVVAMNNIATITLPSTPISSTVKIVAKLVKTTATYRGKSLNTVSETLGLTTPNYVLSNTDGVQLLSVTHSSGLDLTNSFKLDGGQRDTVYDYARLIPTGSIPTIGNIVVEYTYFAHTAGDFFCRNSYNIPYTEIPFYTLSNGSTLFAGSVVDFRRSVSASGYDYTPGFASTFEADSDLISNYSTYLPRIDKIIVDKFGKFRVLSGTPATNPQARADVDNALTLYTVRVNPYTFSNSDVSVTTTKSKRYTMQDIGKLESRIERVEYYSALNLLESQTANQEFLDKFKTGFLVDSFKSQKVADITDPALSVSYNMTVGEIRPQTPFRYIPMVYSSGNNVKLIDNMVMLDYATLEHTNQPLGSNIVRINQFYQYTWNGHITLSPSTDSWFAEEYLPDVYVDGGTYSVISSANTFDASYPSGTTQFVTGSSESSSVIGVDDNGIVPAPFMRSMVITVKCSGLMPNTKLYSYFDDVSVDQFIKPSGGNLGDALITNGSGGFVAEFHLPSTTANRFRCGERIFRVSDTKATDTLQRNSASAPYSAIGQINQKTRRVLTTRTVYITESYNEQPVVRLPYVNPTIITETNIPAPTDGLGGTYGPGTSDVDFSSANSLLESVDNEPHTVVLDVLGTYHGYTTGSTENIGATPPTPTPTPFSGFGGTGNDPSVGVVSPTINPSDPGTFGAFGW